MTQATDTPSILKGKNRQVHVSRKTKQCKQMVRNINAKPQQFSLFKLWLALFTILNIVDVVQTWLFFDYESNPVFALFPSVSFALKICWTFLAPSVLYLLYPKNPSVIYFGTLALVLLYLAIIITNFFSIFRIISP